MRRRALLLGLGGAAAATARVAQAQQRTIPVLGFLGTASPGPNAPFMTALRRGLSEGGYDEGKTVAIEYRWAEGHYDRLPALAADLVGRKVRLLVVQGGSAPALAAKKATSTIPIVFITGDDPVADGVVKSIARPGGNATGITWITSSLGPKRIELLREIAPGASTFGLLVNPRSVEADPSTKAIQDAALAQGVSLRVFKAASESEIDMAFAAMAREHVGGLVVGSDPYLGSRRSQIAALAARQRLPTIAGLRQFAADGGLMSYGPSLSDAFHQGGLYAAKILKGAKPGDLPVLQPTSFELVINQKTAKEIGLALSPSLLARADEVIE